MDAAILVVVVLLLALELLGVFGVLNRGWREESVRRIGDRVAEQLLADKALASAIADSRADWSWRCPNCQDRNELRQAFCGGCGQRRPQQ